MGATKKIAEKQCFTAFSTGMVTPWCSKSPSVVLGRRFFVAQKSSSFDAEAQPFAKPVETASVELARIIQSPRRKPADLMHAARLPHKSILDRPFGHTAPLPPHWESLQRAVRSVNWRGWRQESEGDRASVRTHDDTNADVASSMTVGLQSAVS